MVNEEMTVPSSSYTSSPMNENGYNNDDDDCFMMEDNVDVDHDDGPPPQPSTPSSSSSSSSCDHISGMDDTFKNSNDVTSNERSSVSPMDDGIDTVVVFQNNNNKLRQSNRNNRTNGRTTNRILIVLQWFGSFVRILVLDVPLTVLFASFIFVVGIQHISNKYFIPQIELMSYITTKRELEDSTYYRRHCTTEDVSATSLAPLQLLSGRDTPDSAIEKMLTHGVVTFPERLLSKETCDAARAFIVAENDIHPHQWGLLAGANRHAWGIDMNMDPSIKQIWKELSSNRLFVESVEAIVGKDPAVVEFTAITAKYGAKSQKDHADVMNGASATQQARSFLTSYSLFIPLQDTTKDMGATSICPGTHLCNEGASDACYDGHRNIVMTGEKEFDDDDDDDDNLVLETGNTTTSAQMKMKSPPVWEQGTGMMYNQQVIHKGRAHTQVDGPDRVILILTFAPRPTTSRGGLETRIIPLRSAYQLLWRMYGHTLYDYANAETRMTEPFKTLRALGLVKGNGINWITSVMSQLANEEHGGYDQNAFEKFIDDGDFFKYLPPTLQFPIIEKFLTYVYPVEPEGWNDYIRGSLHNTENLLLRLNVCVLLSYLFLMLLLDVLLMTIVGDITFTRRKDKQRKPTRTGFFLRSSAVRLLVTHTIVVVIAKSTMKEIDNTNWAKSILSGKAYRFPVYESDHVDTWLPSTLPDKSDVLINKEYSSEYYGSYTRVMDYAHPGNVVWRRLMETYGEGYSMLPSNDLRRDFCNTIVTDVQTDRRFLKPDLQRHWGRITDQTELLDFCHRELIMASDPLRDALLRTVDSLLMETRFGRFRWTVMQNDHMPRLLHTWDELLTGTTISNLSRPAKSQKNGRRKPKGKPNNSFRSTSINKVTQSNIRPYSRRYSLPPKKEPKEPYNGAWWQEDDIVEVMEGCRTNRWHKANITYADPTKMSFSVVYPNGDTAIQIQRHCIREFKPYYIGEEVWLSSSSSSSSHNDDDRKGRIISIHEGATIFDVQLTDTNDDVAASGDDDDDEVIIAREPVEDIYRVIPTGGNIDVGMKVLARRLDKTTTIEFDDGTNHVNIEVGGQTMTALKVGPKRKKRYIFSPGVVTRVLDADNNAAAGWYEVDIEGQGEESFLADDILCLDCVDAAELHLTGN